MFGERPRNEVLAALPVMLLGVVLISGVIGAGAYGIDPQLGVAIGVLTATSYAGYLLIIRRATPDRRAAAPVAIATAVTAVCAGLFGTAVGDLDLTPGMPADAYLIALGILSQSVGYLAIQVSLPRLPAVVASVLLLVQPVTTVFLGAILLRELPSPVPAAGRRAGDRRHRAGDGLAGPDRDGDPGRGGRPLVGLVGLGGAPHLASGLIGRLRRAVVRRQVRSRASTRRG